MTFRPRLDALPAPQRALWPELAAVPRRYVLYGGTALALRLAHRPSVDFDFFAHDHLDHHELETAVPFIPGAAVLDEGPDTRTILVTRAGGGVRSRSSAESRSDGSEIQNLPTMGSCGQRRCSTSQAPR
jgi:hypothetical protein